MGNIKKYQDFVRELPQRVMIKDLILIAEKEDDLFPTVKVYYNRIFLAEAFFNAHHNSCFLFFNKKYFPISQKEIKTDTYIDDITDIYKFNLDKEKVKIIGSVMTEFNPDIHEELINNISYDNYKQSYEVFNKCFDEKNNHVWKVK
jgi:hypothetical protein